jgi:hypothetical protein
VDAELRVAKSGTANQNTQYTEPEYFWFTLC